MDLTPAAGLPRQKRQQAVRSPRAAPSVFLPEGSEIRILLRRFTQGRVHFKGALQVGLRSLPIAEDGEVAGDIVVKERILDQSGGALQQPVPRGEGIARFMEAVGGMNEKTGLLRLL